MTGPTAVSHLENLIAEFYDWQGYLIRRNVKVGRLTHGGWEMELDIVAYHPHSGDLLHFEPSLDAHPWSKREQRFEKKFSAARRYVFSEIFTWLDPTIPLKQIAVVITHPAGRDTLAGGQLVSVDELTAEIRERVRAEGRIAKSAIPEQYPLLRTIQLLINGYYRVHRNSP